MSSIPSEQWSVEQRGDQESQVDATRVSNGSEFISNGSSHDLVHQAATGLAPGPGSIAFNGASVQEDAPPSAKRPRNTMIRYYMNSHTFVLFQSV